MKLEFEKIGLSYGKRTVLTDVCFCVERGSITALLGRNGAGKSSLIACLTGENRRYSGRVLLDGQDTKGLSQIKRSRLVACLPQVLPLPRVTVWELAAFGRAPYLPLTGILSPEDKTAVEQALEAVGMTGLEDALVDTLSGGERKKAFLAMALAQDTPLLVLDEPTAHLDAASRFELLALVERLRREMGKTVLVVMHELPEVLTLADRLVVLQDGTVAFDGTPEHCLSQGIDEHCFGISVTGSKEDGYAVRPRK